jgi:hypothetical protein
MGSRKAPVPEQAVLRAHAAGRLSADQAFERLHSLHAPAVRAFLYLRVPSAGAEDLVQEAWTIFYARGRVSGPSRRDGGGGRQACPQLPLPHLPLPGERASEADKGAGVAPAETGDDHRGAHGLLRKAEGREIDYAIPFALSLMGPTAWNAAEVERRQARSLGDLITEFRQETIRLQDLVLRLDVETSTRAAAPTACAPRPRPCSTSRTPTPSPTRW